MKREILEKRERQLDNLEQALVDFEKLQRIFKTQTVAIYIAIVLLFISVAVNAQTVHTVDTAKYTYLDLDYRVVKPDFFYEKNMGWKNYFFAYDGVIFRKVWIDTIK